MILSMMMAWGLIAGTDATGNPFFVGGTIGGAGVLLILLIRELRRSGDGAWKVVRGLRSDVHRLRYDRDVEHYYREVAEQELRIRDGLALPGSKPTTPPPGPYVPPTDQELKAWL